MKNVADRLDAGVFGEISQGILSNRIEAMKTAVEKLSEQISAQLSGEKLNEKEQERILEEEIRLSFDVINNDLPQNDKSQIDMLEASAISAKSQLNNNQRGFMKLKEVNLNEQNINQSLDNLFVQLNESVLSLDAVQHINQSVRNWQAGQSPAFQNKQNEVDSGISFKTSEQSNVQAVNKQDIDTETLQQEDKARTMKHMSNFVGVLENMAENHEKIEADPQFLFQKGLAQMKDLIMAFDDGTAKNQQVKPLLNMLEEGRKRN